MTDRDDLLRRWQTEEATVRARLAAPGVASPKDVKASSGIEFLQRIFNGELPSPPIGETLGFVPISAEPGRVVFQGTPDKRHYNPLGGVHGGYSASLSRTDLRDPQATFSSENAHRSGRRGCVMDRRPAQTPPPRVQRLAGRSREAPAISPRQATSGSTRSERRRA